MKPGDLIQFDNGRVGFIIKAYSSQWGFRGQSWNIEFLHGWPDCSSSRGHLTLDEHSGFKIFSSCEGPREDV